MYSAAVLKYFAVDTHIGRLDAALSGVATGVAGVAGRGDVIQLQLAIEKDVILQVKGLVYGCPASIAALAWLAEQLPGKTLQQSTDFESQMICDALALPPTRFAAAQLAIDALKAALVNYHDKQNRGSS